MRKSNRKPQPVAMLLVLVLFTALLCPLMVNAKAEVADIEGVSYNASAPLQENLQSFAGKKISVTLASGKILTGFVKQVGTHLLHLEKLDGNDFSDALIRIEDICAIEAKFREFRR